MPNVGGAHVLWRDGGPALGLDHVLLGDDGHLLRVGDERVVGDGPEIARDNRGRGVADADAGDRGDCSGGGGGGGGRDGGDRRVAGDGGRLRLAHGIPARLFRVHFVGNGAYRTSMSTGRGGPGRAENVTTVFARPANGETNKKRERRAMFGRSVAVNAVRDTTVFGGARVRLSTVALSRRPRFSNVGRTHRRRCPKNRLLCLAGESFVSFLHVVDPGR